MGALTGGFLYDEVYRPMRVAFTPHGLPLDAAQASQQIQTAEQARQWISDVSMIRELTPEDYEILLLLDEDVKQLNVMSSEAIAALPAVVASETADVECSICLCEMRCGEDIRMLPPCGHCFHFDCLHDWLSSRKNTCPLCAQPCM